VGRRSIGNGLVFKVRGHALTQGVQGSGLDVAREVGLDTARVEGERDEFRAIGCSELPGKEDVGGFGLAVCYPLETSKPALEQAKYV
jgi:hypothetical protein